MTNTTTHIPLALLPATYWANYTGRCPLDAVNCYRILQPWEIVLLSASILALAFHCLVFSFLMTKALRGHAHFSSPFHKLYLVLAVTEIVTLVEVRTRNVYVTHKIRTTFALATGIPPYPVCDAVNLVFMPEAAKCVRT